MEELTTTGAATDAAPTQKQSMKVAEFRAGLRDHGFILDQNKKYASGFIKTLDILPTIAVKVSIKQSHGMFKARYTDINDGAKVKIVAWMPNYEEITHWVNTEPTRALRVSMSPFMPQHVTYCYQSPSGSVMCGGPGVPVHTYPSIYSAVSEIKGLVEIVDVTHSQKYRELVTVFTENGFAHNGKGGFKSSCGNYAIRVTRENGEFYNVHADIRVAFLRTNSWSVGSIHMDKVFEACIKSIPAIENYCSLVKLRKVIKEVNDQLAEARAALQSARPPAPSNNIIAALLDEFSKFRYDIHRRVSLKKIYLKSSISDAEELLVTHDNDVFRITGKDGIVYHEWQPVQTQQIADVVNRVICQMPEYARVIALIHAASK